MARSRIIFHPIIENKQSQKIVGLFLIISILFSFVFFWPLISIIQSISQQYSGEPFLQNIGIRLLNSWMVKFVFVLFVGIVTGSVVSSFVLGPANRIIEWLLEWEKGKILSPLKVRGGHGFDRLVQLINELHSQNQKK
ncbi:MAG: hypothetical protein ACKVQC_01005 [Elusimicrobiota bacterium]